MCWVLLSHPCQTTTKRQTIKNHEISLQNGLWGQLDSNQRSRETRDLQVPVYYKPETNWMKRDKTENTIYTKNSYLNSSSSISASTSNYGRNYGNLMASMNQRRELVQRKRLDEREGSLVNIFNYSIDQHSVSPYRYIYKHQLLRCTWTFFLVYVFRVDHVDQFDQSTSNRS